MKNVLRPIMMAAALGSAPSMGISQTISASTLNANNCASFIGIQIDPSLASIIKTLNGKSKKSCLDSQNFMALVNIAQIEENQNNYRIQEVVITTYQKYKEDSSKSKRSARTLAMIDARMEAQGLKIQDFYDRYNTNKPQTISQTQEESCLTAIVRKNGALYEESVCNVPVSPNSPQP